jgi:imidazolonepropionase-like amidohydrolase
VERKRGTLERGKVADLILVDADPTRDVVNLRELRAVMRRGVLRGAAELSRAASRHP